MIPGQGKAIAPGLANCHTHLARILARGVFEDQRAQVNRPPFTRRGFVAFPKMTLEERDAMVRLAALEAIRSGTTLLMEVWSSIADYADVLIGSGLRLVLAEQVSDRPAGARVGEPAPLMLRPKPAVRSRSGPAARDSSRKNVSSSNDGRL